MAWSSISAALLRATSTRSWKPLKSWVRSGGVGGGVLNNPLLLGLRLPSREELMEVRREAMEDAVMTSGARATEVMEDVGEEGCWC